ncbi:MAG: 3-deoxy-manno-octulosonate cytidylyltransferase [Endomicrobiales bacterium]|nr:3-deoxy-manno-octulosonate cytidylyltransferase [Endomicrobiales bacterium]
MKIKALGIIPARYASTRFPGKPLALIKGKTLVQRVWLRAKKARSLDDAVIATDDARIFSHAKKIGAKAVMTPKTCASGTDRLCAAAKKIKGGHDILVNIQGDEPLIAPGTVDAIVGGLKKDRSLVCATAAYELKNKKDINDPNIVKVVFDDNYMALYFSRYPVPYPRGAQNTTKYFKHLGIYGFRRGFLKKFSSWKQTRLEKAEKLEQLRILEKGYGIKVVLSRRDSSGVDRPGDVKKIERLLK